MGRGNLCGQYKSVHGIVAKLKNAYLTGIRIVTHEKVFCRFHLENKGV